jgi:alpha-glucosidase (family GH31 glycosyl hydrolase)
MHNLDKYLPYVPGNNPTIDYKTVKSDVIHADGKTQELFAHSFYNFFQSKATYQFFKSQRKMVFPFILTRATIFGVNQYASHWTGDNAATHQWMMASIPQIMLLNLFGIPQSGADICGFQDDTNIELCARWVQLGSLYPFSRNHNSFGCRSQEPVALGPIVLRAFRNSFNQRYALLRHYYSLFVHQKGIGTIFRPLFFEFPGDPQLYEEPILSEQFLLGESLLAAPVLRRGSQGVRPYFPNGTWYHLQHGQAFEGQSKQDILVDLTGAPLLFLREGHLIQMQNSTQVQRVDELNSEQRSELRLVAALAKSAGVEYRSTGRIMTLRNLSDEGAVFARCWHADADCSLVATVTLDANEQSLRVTFRGHTPQTSIDEIKIKEIVLFGRIFNDADAHNLTCVLMPKLEKLPETNPLCRRQSNKLTVTFSNALRIRGECEYSLSLRS